MLYLLSVSLRVCHLLISIISVCHLLISTAFNSFEKVVAILFQNNVIILQNRAGIMLQVMHGSGCM